MPSSRRETGLTYRPIFGAGVPSGTWYVIKRGRE